MKIKSSFSVAAMMLFLAFLLVQPAFFATAQGINLPAGISATATGTGQTTGVIAHLTLTNTTQSPVTLNVGPLFIPSDGEHQSYIVPGSKPVQVAPGVTQPVPLDGFCVDVNRPPVPAGVQMPDPSTWITPQPLPDGWRPSTDKGWKPKPDSPVTIPGTYIPLGHTIDVDRFPYEAAPVIFEAIENISLAFEELKEEGSIITPYLNKPEREREAVVQQSLWIFTSILTGFDYEKDDFRENTINQFEENSGQDYETQPEDIKESIEAGVTAFWNTFEAVGERAKVFRSLPGKTPPYSDEDEELKCSIETKVRFNPPYDLAVCISNNWGGASEREKIESEFRSELKRHIDNLRGEATRVGGETYEFGVSTTPLSAHAYWVPEIVGGQVNSFAWTIMRRRGQSSLYIRSTEELLAEVSGERTLEVSINADEGCSSHVVIVCASRVEAMSYAFDPIADHVEVLRPLAFIGNLAVDFLLAKLRGATSLKSFLLGKVKDAAKAELERKFDELEQKVREIASDYIRDNLGDTAADGLEIIDWLVNEFDDNPEESTLNLVKEQLVEALGEMLGFDVGEGVENLEWLLEQLDKMPKDIILDNIPDLDMAKISGASVYALAEGKITHKVGQNSGAAHTRSHVSYERSGLEDNAITGGGVYLSEVIVSDQAQGGLRAVATAEAKTGGRASGNGHARATLNSFTATVAVAVCYCPDGTHYDMYTTFSYSDRDKYGHLLDSFLDMAENKIDEIFDRDSPTNPGQIESELKEATRQWLEGNR